MRWHRGMQSVVSPLMDPFLGRYRQSWCHTLDCLRKPNVYGSVSVLTITHVWCVCVCAHIGHISK